MGGRNTTATFNAALVGPVTSVGYLLQIAGVPPSTLRFCDIGDQNFLTFLWSELDFTISGFTTEADRPLGQNITLKMSNHDGAITAILQAITDVAALVFTIRQFARGVNAVDADAPLLGSTFAAGNIEVEPGYVTFQLLPLANGYLSAPRKRVTSENGFNSATPAGTILQWGNQVFELEERNG